MTLQTLTYDVLSIDGGVTPLGYILTTLIILTTIGVSYHFNSTHFEGGE